MENKLQQRFPMIRTREQILKEIFREERLKRKFLQWDLERRDLFLDMFTGARG